MPSKYDSFWAQREEDLDRLLREVYTKRRSQLAIPEPRAVGNRQSWAASVAVAAGKVLAAHGAHGKSLDHVLARLSQRYPDALFRVRITEDLSLRIRRAGKEPEDSTSRASSPPLPREEYPHLATPREESPRLVTPPADPDPAVEGDPAAVARCIHELAWRLPSFTGLPRRSALPTGGIYFWFERGEASETHPGSCGWASTRAGNCGTGSSTTTGGPGAGPPSWLIACLARGRWPEPSPGWLGHHSARPEVRQSGLWNIEGVGAHHCRDCGRWLARLAELVEWSARGRTGGETSVHS